MIFQPELFGLYVRESHGSPPFELSLMSRMIARSWPRGNGKGRGFCIFRGLDPLMVSALATSISEHRSSLQPFTRLRQRAPSFFDCLPRLEDGVKVQGALRVHQRHRPFLQHTSSRAKPVESSSSRLRRGCSCASFITETRLGS